MGLYWKHRDMPGRLPALAICLVAYCGLEDKKCDIEISTAKIEDFTCLTRLLPKDDVM